MFLCYDVLLSDAELLKLLQVVVERLDVGKHTHGVRLVPHLQHVVHLDQTQTVRLLPETQTHQNVCNPLR